MTAIDFLQPTFSRGFGASAASAIRSNGNTIVCGSCGCRLTTHESADDAGFTGARRWFHYAGRPGRDARGCTVACVDAAHHLA